MQRPSPVDPDSPGVFHVDVPLLTAAASSSNLEKATRRAGEYVCDVKFERRALIALASMGGVLAIAAPFISCWVGFGKYLNDKMAPVQNDRNDIDWDTCFSSEEDASVSVIIGTPIGAATFACGMTLFYSIYTLCVVRMICQLSRNGTSAYAFFGGALVFISIEVISAFGTVACPMVNNLTSDIHGTLTEIWVVSGCIGACIQLALAYKNVTAWDTLRKLVCFRSTVLPILGLSLLASREGMALRSEFRPSFRLFESVFIVAHISSGMILVYLFAMPYTCSSTPIVARRADAGTD